MQHTHTHTHTHAHVFIYCIMMVWPIHCELNLTRSFMLDTNVYLLQYHIAELKNVLILFVNHFFSFFFADVFKGPLVLA